MADCGYYDKSHKKAQERKRAPVLKHTETNSDAVVGGVFQTEFVTVGDMGQTKLTDLSKSDKVSQPEMLSPCDIENGMDPTCDYER